MWNHAASSSRKTLWKYITWTSDRPEKQSKKNGGIREEPPFFVIRRKPIFLKVLFRRLGPLSFPLFFLLDQVRCHHLFQGVAGQSANGAPQVPENQHHHHHEGNRSEERRVGKECRSRW